MEAIDSDHRVTVDLVETTVMRDVGLVVFVPAHQIDWDRVKDFEDQNLRFIKFTMALKYEAGFLQYMNDGTEVSDAAIENAKAKLRGPDVTVNHHLPKSGSRRYVLLYVSAPDMEKLLAHVNPRERMELPATNSHVDVSVDTKEISVLTRRSFIVT